MSGLAGASELLLRPIRDGDRRDRNWWCPAAALASAIQRTFNMNRLSTRSLRRAIASRATLGSPRVAFPAGPPRAHLARRLFSHSSPAWTEPSKTAAQLLAEYSELRTRTVKLSDLTQYGRPPLTEQALLDSAERTRKELMIGLAGRVTQHLSLPFLPSTNPSLHKIYQLYYDAFTDLAKVPAPVATLEDNDKLVEVIERMVQAHSENM